MARRAISLEYHDVYCLDPDETGFSGSGPASYKLAISEFRRHIEQIARGRAASLIGRVDRWERGDVVFLTFDDGGRSAVDTIAPILEQVGWPGHFMVTSDFVGSETFVGPDSICELVERGHVISAHSASHPARMASLTDWELNSEWRDSVEALSEIVGFRISTASVPGGLYSRRVAKAAERAGIQHLFTSEATTRVLTVGGCSVLGRYSIRAWTPARTAAALSEGRPTPRARQWAAGVTRRTLRMLGGPLYLRFRNLYWQKTQERKS